MTQFLSHFYTRRIVFLSYSIRVSVFSAFLSSRLSHCRFHSFTIIVALVALIFFMPFSSLSISWVSSFKLTSNLIVPDAFLIWYRRFLNSYAKCTKAQMFLLYTFISYACTECWHCLKIKRPSGNISFTTDGMKMESEWKLASTFKLILEHVQCTLLSQAKMLQNLKCEAQMSR